MVDLTQPSFLTPTITVKGDVVVGKTLRVGPPVAGTGDGGGSSVVVGYPEKFQINGVDVKGLTVHSTQTYNGKTYNVYRGVNLLTTFEATIGRQPNVGENVVLSIPNNVALVGSATSIHGLIIPSTMPVTGVLAIANAGLIIGKGGDGFGSNMSAGQDGGTGVNNQLNIEAKIYNYGLVSGGGGGGGGRNTSNQTKYAGGGGAPWGAAGNIRFGRDATAASFTGPGIGDKNTNNDRVGMPGGTWGLKGGDNGALGGLGGFISEGKVTIENLVDGFVLGRSDTVNLTSTLDFSNMGTIITANNPAYAESKSGGVFNNKTYAVYREVNILTIFQAKFGRTPLANEIVNVLIPDGFALVGTEANPDGILVPSTWTASSPVNIENRGLILGIGGNAKKFGTNALAVENARGKTGIKNASTAVVTVKNYGGIAGGGGAGGTAMDRYYLGGAGAPWGPWTYQDIGNGQDSYGASFTAGGGAAGYGSNRGGTGAGWGLPGANGYGGTSNSTAGGDAGFISEGNVAIKNLNDGWSKGKEGSFTGTPEEPETPVEPEEPETPTIDAEGHLIAYGGKLGTNGYISSTGAAIQGAHGQGGVFNVLESIENVIITKKSADAGRVGGSPNYWDTQPGGDGYRDYFNEVVGTGGTGAAPAKAGTATAGGAGGGAAHVRGTIKNLTNQAITIMAYCGKAYRQSPMAEQQMGAHGSLQLLLSTVGGDLGGDIDFIYPNAGRTATDITVLNNESAEIWLVGGGGGAGGASKAASLGTNGVNGSTSVLMIGNVNQIAGGGIGGSFSTAATKQEGTSVVWVNSDGANGNGGSCTVNRSLSLPDGIQINFEVVEDGFKSSGKNNQGISRGGEGKIIGTWGTFGLGGEPAALVGDVQPLATPGAGGGGAYVKVVITNTSGENFTVKAIAGAKGIDGISRFGERINAAMDGIVIVRKGGIQSNTSETIVSLPESTQSFVSLAINEEMDFEMIGGGGAGGSVSYYVGATQVDLTNMGGNGQIASMKLADELKWDGSQYVQPETTLFAMEGGYGGGPSFGTKPGTQGEPPATFTDVLVLPSGITITGQYTRGKATTRTSDTARQLGQIGYTAIDGVVYGSGGDGGDGNPSSPGAGASGNVYKGTIKNTSNKVFNFRLDTQTKGTVKTDATLGDGRGQNGGAPGLVYKRRYNSGTDETRLIYPEDAQKDIFIPNNAQAEIWIIGGGGAFGGSTPYPTPITGMSVLDNGEAGVGSQVVIGSNTFIAGGGKGGVGAIGGTVSLSSGVAGIPTVPTITPITGLTIRVDEQVSGTPVPSTIARIDNPGGHVIPGVGQFGYGGACRWDSKSVQPGNFEADIFRGGSGGSGAFIKLTVNNTSGVSQVVKAIAGKAGSRSSREFYDIVEMAGSGLVVIKIKKL